jgi:DNA-binding response OmpR family regulator
MAKRKNVLVIGNNEILWTRLIESLNNLYDISCLQEDVSEAVIAEEKPDLIILEIMRPKPRGGLMAFFRIRSWWPGPILMLTVPKDVPANVVQTFDTTSNNFLSDYLTMEIVLERIKKIFSQQQ